MVKLRWRIPSNFACLAPDNIKAAAGALIAAASGAVRVKTTVLMTPEEVDEVSKISVDYRPPGQ